MTPTQADRERAEQFFGSWPRVTVPDYLPVALAEAFAAHRVAALEECIAFIRARAQECCGVADGDPLVTAAAYLDGCANDLEVALAKPAGQEGENIPVLTLNQLSAKDVG